MDIEKSIGMTDDPAGFKSQKNIRRYINLKLAALGQPWHVRKGEGLIYDQPKSSEESKIDSRKDKEFIELMSNIIENYQEQKRLLKSYLCPVDRRIQDFLHQYFDDIDENLNMPDESFILDRYGLARFLSLPPDSNVYESEYINSYRIKQGILNNPKHDRRTTKGSFHIVEGGPLVPHDKKLVPKIVFARLFQEAMMPPKELMEVPFTASQKNQAHSFVSLYQRPIVSPGIKGKMPHKSIEVRFIVPASLVSTLDFVESVFGNAGDPNLIENDAALDIDHWSGHTGCIILAPHLTKIRKEALGLPHYDYATERQRKEGMCWKAKTELYNDGSPFKITARDEKGRVVTIIADNYFGYSKKEIKTQLSYAANLMGNVEEEHAGGTLVFPQYNLSDKAFAKTNYKFEDVKKNYSRIMNIHDGNYADDIKFPNIHYIPENAIFDLYDEKVSWEYGGQKRSLTLLPKHYYIYPDGYKIHMEKHPSAPTWRLVGTVADGVFCHKPCTVSGGGKSEISKSLLNSVIYGPFHISDVEKDFALADKIINYDYSNRWKKHKKRKTPSRPLLSPERSLGSVIKLLTPSEYCTDEYNEFLQSIPHNVKGLVFCIKRFYRPEWKGNWQKYFSVNQINGQSGHELYFNGRKIIDTFLRVGYAEDGSWSVHRLRNDFIASAKIQMEDDITASTTLPANRFEYIESPVDAKSVKLLTNCEYRLFQRPDEAIHKGYDKEAEQDLARNNVFITNYQPLTPQDARKIMNDAIGFDKYTEPIKKIIRSGELDHDNSFFISPSHPRIMPDGSRSTNPRYLQTRPDFSHPIEYYLAEIGMRLKKRIPESEPLYFAVDSVLPARRNNPPEPDKGIKPLSVYNPIHYQELPELFMDFICSLSGKSPSTTGAGSEGALTKGPFNMLSPVPDLNNALLSYILTGYHGYTSAAGFIGVNSRIDHDISILVPELFSRMNEELQNPRKLIEEGSLEKVEDFEYQGRTVKASRLGYRITSNLLFRYFGRIFDEPQAVFPEKILRPETEDLQAFVDGVDNIVDSQRRVARMYFDDGSIEKAIPPLKALLHIMVYDHFDGKTIDDSEIRELFDAEYVIKSQWYKKRLKYKQNLDINKMKRHIEDLENFIEDKRNKSLIDKMNLMQKLDSAHKDLEYKKSEAYYESLIGTIGAEPVF